MHRHLLIFSLHGALYIFYDLGGGILFCIPQLFLYSSVVEAQINAAPAGRLAATILATTFATTAATAATGAT